MRKLLLGIVATSAVAAMAGANMPKAQAGEIAAYCVGSTATCNSIADFTFVTLTPGTSGSVSDAPMPLTVGTDTITNLSMLSNSPGTPSLAQVLSSSLQVINNGPGTETIQLLIGDNGFAAPATPPNITLNSHVGGSVAVGNAANALSFATCVNSNATESCFGSPLAEAGPGTPSITAADAFAQDNFATISSLAAPYSIVQDLSLTLGAGSEMNFSDNSTLVPVPEPVSLSLLGTALVGLGVIRRRRRA